MKEQLQHVDFDTAALLKEVGFGWKTHTGYIHIVDNPRHIPHPLDWGYCNYNGEHATMAHNQIAYSRPTLHLCTQWIREVKGLHVAVNLTHDGWYWQNISTITGGCFAEQSFIDTHDLALSSGITKALELLKNSK